MYENHQVHVKLTVHKLWNYNGWIGSIDILNRNLAIRGK